MEHCRYWYRRLGCMLGTEFFLSFKRIAKCRPFRRRRRHRQRKIGMTSLIRTGRRYHVSVDRGRGCSTRIGSFQNWCRPETLLPTPCTTTGGGYGPGPGGYGPPPQQFMPPTFPPAREMVLSKCIMLFLIRLASSCPGQAKEKRELSDRENAPGFS